MLAVLILVSLVLSACKTHLQALANLVSFGDSDTDERRMSYILANNFSLPPAETLLPPVKKTHSMGVLVWSRFVAQRAGLKSFNYAIGGFSCSTDLVERSTADINRAGTPPINSPKHPNTVFPLRPGV